MIKLPVCAPLLHQQLHTENCGLLRFSFSNNNTLDEVKLAIKALKQIMEDVWKQSKNGFL